MKSILPLNFPIKETEFVDGKRELEEKSEICLRIFCALNTIEQVIVIRIKVSLGDFRSMFKQCTIDWFCIWIWQIMCSTVGQVLDPILKQESLVIGSAYGKKKKKSDEHQKSNFHADVIYKGENALSFLSSLLDILLLKKDIANRSVS